jgi:hypothetical protein
MNAPANENPKRPKHSRRKPAMEPLGWDEIVSQPGMGGYLSFLNGPVPLPHLQGSATGREPIPGVVSNPMIEATAAVNSDPDVPSDPGPVPPPGVRLGFRDQATSPIVSDPVVASSPLVNVSPEIIPIPSSVQDIEYDSSDHALSITGVVSTPVCATPPEIARNYPYPEVVSTPGSPASQRLRIRKCAATHDGHSLGEEVLYQALWKASQAESAETRTIVIGWRGMSQLCRMTPKNCKINTQRLIRKLALEILSPYNTPESIGTTYRVYCDEAILQRRRKAGLEWVVRSRGVEFVNPATGVSIVPICA